MTVATIHWQAGRRTIHRVFYNPGSERARQVGGKVEEVGDYLYPGSSWPRAAPPSGGGHTLQRPVGQSVQVCVPGGDRLTGVCAGRETGTRSIMSTRYLLVTGTASAALSKGLLPLLLLLPPPLPPGSSSRCVQTSPQTPGLHQAPGDHNQHNVNCHSKPPKTMESDIRSFSLATHFLRISYSIVSG